MNGELFKTLLSLVAALTSRTVHFGFVYEANIGHRIYFGHFEDDAFKNKFRQALIDAGAQDTGKVSVLWDSVLVPIEKDIYTVIAAARTACKQ